MHVGEPLPAIVMGRGPTALGMIRSLHAAGIPAYVACPADDLVTHSRFYRPTPGAVPWDGRPGPHAFEALRAMPLDRAVILPGADDAALWLTELVGSDLAARFLVSTSRRDAQHVLQDKSILAGYLSAIRIPHPRSFRLDEPGDLDAIPFDHLDRVFLKPVNSQKFSDVNGVKGLWVGGREALHEHWLRFRAQGFRVIAQEYIPGPATEHFFIDGFRDRHGFYGGLFARRRLRMSPPDFGNSSCCHSISLDDVPAAVRHVRRLLDGLDYRGIFSAEFKRDARDDEYRLIEVNMRAWTYVEFATHAGVNVCEMAWQDAQDLPVTRAPRDYRHGVACVDLYHDLASIRLASGRQRPALPRLLLQWARARLHVFRSDDPMPAWYFVRGLIGKRVSRSVRAAERGGDVLQ